MQIHLHKAFFSDNWFLDSLHKSFLNQTTLDLRKEKWTFLNREFTVPLLWSWNIYLLSISCKNSRKREIKISHKNYWMKINSDCSVSGSKRNNKIWILSFQTLIAFQTLMSFLILISFQSLCLFKHISSCHLIPPPQ